MFIVVFTLTNIFSILIYCLVGELLRSEVWQTIYQFHFNFTINYKNINLKLLKNWQSLKIGIDVYNTNWYELPAKEAKMLLIIMCVTQTPLKITAGKFTELSLEYFMLVCWELVSNFLFWNISFLLKKDLFFFRFWKLLQDTYLCSW